MDRLSLWQQSSACRLPVRRPPVRTQVVVAGGGLCGLLTAYRLCRRQVSDITVIDAGEMAGGVTAHTTAKITAQHGLIYQRLLLEQGTENAALYAAAAKEAETAYREVTEDLSLSCGYTPCPNALYSTDEQGRKKLEQEAAALTRLGSPFTLDRKSGLPFPATAVLHTSGSAHFHPLQFAYGLIDYLRRQGVIFCPHTAAMGLEDDSLLTTRGKIRADVAVLATHFPFWDMPGRYFARIWQERSYVLAASHIPPLSEMYWGAGEGDVSVRPWPDGLLIGGGSHRTGAAGRRHPLHHLMAQSAPWYPGRRIVAAWSAQDCMTPDGMPYIGRYPQADQPHMRVYLATGFNKWGMTSSMTAAAILAGAITGAAPVYAPLFSPSRTAATRRSFYIENAQVLKHYIGGYCRIPEESLSGLRAGEGRLLTVGGKRVGAYKNRDGRLFLVKPVCTHMGCILNWNAEEKSWDCPCHGSRFDYRGRLLNTPAHRPLTRYKLSE